MDQHVLVPFDGSDTARNALVRAFEEHPEADVTVLYVIDLSELSYGVEGGAAANLHEAEKEEARELFAEAEEVIVEYADRGDVDHVIMGSHGRSGLSRILVGSVAEGVVRESPDDRPCGDRPLATFGPAGRRRPARPTHATPTDD